MFAISKATGKIAVRAAGRVVTLVDTSVLHSGKNISVRRL